jgi:hypothetical protein
MKQALHIFAKDARHFWPEITVSLVITAVFAWTYRYTWMADMVPGIPKLQYLQKLAEIVAGLVPVSWWILITRAVHAESLVGDRQWWITKPYEWPQLLGSKLLFLAAFVLLPFCVAQCVLLEVAGFHWFEYMPGLGFSLVLVLGILVGPLLALAAVTSGFGKMTLTLLGGLVAVVLVAVLGGQMDTGGIASSGDDAGGAASFLLVLVCCGAAIVVQYSRRVSWMSRLLLASVFVPLAAAILLGSSTKLIAMAYPLTSGSVRVVFDPQGGHSPATDAGSGRVGVSVPLLMSGVVDGTAVQVNGVRATFESQDGKTWTSPWLPVYGRLHLPGSSKGGLPLQLDRKFFDQARSKPVNVYVKLAITTLKAGVDRRIVLTGQEFAVRGVGICSWNPTAQTMFDTTEITCLSAMGEPDFTFVSVQRNESSCTDGDAKDEVRSTGSVGGTIGELSPAPAEFGITSVWSRSVWLNDFGTDGERGGRILHPPPLLCPRTPIHFTHYTLMNRSEVDVTLPQFQLPDLEAQVKGIVVPRL